GDELRARPRHIIQITGQSDRALGPAPAVGAGENRGPLRIVDDTEITLAADDDILALIPGGAAKRVRGAGAAPRPGDTVRAGEQDTRTTGGDERAAIPGDREKRKAAAGGARRPGDAIRAGGDGAEIAHCDKHAAARGNRMIDGSTDHAAGHPGHAI